MLSKVASQFHYRFLGVFGKKLLFYILLIKVPMQRKIKFKRNPLISKNLGDTL